MRSTQRTCSRPVRPGALAEEAKPGIVIFGAFYLRGGSLRVSGATLDATRGTAEAVGEPAFSVAFGRVRSEFSCARPFFGLSSASPANGMSIPKCLLRQ